MINEWLFLSNERWSKNEWYFMNEWVFMYELGFLNEEWFMNEWWWFFYFILIYMVIHFLMMIYSCFINDSFFTDDNDSFMTMMLTMFQWLWSWGKFLQRWNIQFFKLNYLQYFGFIRSLLWQFNDQKFSDC